jgi:hypothetical protein
MIFNAFTAIDSMKNKYGFRSQSDPDAPYNNIFAHLQKIIFRALGGNRKTDNRGSSCSENITSFEYGVISPHFEPGSVARKPAYRGTRRLISIDTDCVDNALKPVSIPIAAIMAIVRHNNRYFGNLNLIDVIAKAINMKIANKTICIRIEKPKVSRREPVIYFLLKSKHEPRATRATLGRSEFTIGAHADQANPIKKRIVIDNLFTGNTCTRAIKAIRLIKRAAMNGGMPIKEKGAYSKTNIPPFVYCEKSKDAFQNCEKSLTGVTGNRKAIATKRIKAKMEINNFGRSDICIGLGTVRFFVISIQPFY